MSKECFAKAPGSGISAPVLQSNSGPRQPCTWSINACVRFILPLPSAISSPSCNFVHWALELLLFFLQWNNSFRAWTSREEAASVRLGSFLTVEGFDKYTKKHFGWRTRPTHFLCVLFFTVHSRARRGGLLGSEQEGMSEARSGIALVISFSGRGRPYCTGSGATPPQKKNPP